MSTTINLLRINRWVPERLNFITRILNKLLCIIISSFHFTFLFIYKILYKFKILICWSNSQICVQYYMQYAFILRFYYCVRFSKIETHVWRVRSLMKNCQQSKHIQEIGAALLFNHSAQLI